MVNKALTALPALTMAITAARMHHAVTSSAAAHAMATVPMRVPESPRS